MTAIAAIVYADGVMMGGDLAAANSSFRLEMHRDPKVFRVGELIVGCTTSLRMSQLIRYGLDDCLKVADLHPPSEPVEGFEFMVCHLVPRVRWLLDKGGFTTKKDAVEWGGMFLVAWGRQVFGVAEAFQVSDYADDYAACGCGADLVRGALSACCEGADGPAALAADTARRFIETALRAAERHSAGVQGPFVIESTAPLSHAGCA